jgi:hypothetical protein
MKALPVVGEKLQKILINRRIHVASRRSKSLVYTEVAHLFKAACLCSVGRMEIGAPDQFKLNKTLKILFKTTEGLSHGENS